MTILNVLSAINTIILIGILVSIAWLNVVKLRDNKSNIIEDHSVEIKQMEIERLSFEEINTVIGSVVSEVVDNKYMLNYTIRDIRIIPDMEKEAELLTKDILAAFNDRFLDQVYRFYTPEYFVQYVTRVSQMFLVSYTDKHKPTTK